MAERASFEVNDVDSPRLDVFLANRLPQLSRSAIQTLIREGRVAVNGQTPKVSARLSPGDQVEAEVILPPSLSAVPQDIPLTIVYEDQDLAVIDKPAGLVVHPAAGHESGTLTNALVARFPYVAKQDRSERPGIVHRLDKDTSGLMVVALNPASQKSLQQQIASREMRRQYLALAAADVDPTEGIIQAPIGRDRTDPKRMATYGTGQRPAITRYRVLEKFNGFTLVQATLQTGRTHQIRVHFKAIGHPLAGDRTYGGTSLPGLDRQFLHAYRLGLRHPSSGDLINFESPLPRDLENTLKSLRAGRGGRI